ncbi:GlcG/HbpS family heme-binding protein [Klebsiella sp. I138]|uniref:GlcG/HbpS family heme-binding protein n=1 Tax=Klebsiella sp. I138 TaxID=2755385 RepID=UPI003DA8EEEA
MHSTSNPELDRCINEAISRQLTPPPASLSLLDAASLARYANDAANNANVPIVFSLVDTHGHQRYFFSQDNVLLISHTLATQKAWSAVALKMPTHQLAAEVLPGASLYGLQHAQGLCCFGGGLPCWSGGVLLGAIGVSGGSVEEDIAIATQTLARFSRERFSLTPFNESF